jgi:Transcription factor WhiB
LAGTGHVDLGRKREPGTVQRARQRLNDAGLVPVLRGSRSPVPPIRAMPPMPGVLADGLCARHPQPDIWCSRQPADRQAAVRVCQQCPVREPCLQWALVLPPTSAGAVYGGLLPAQLARLRREHERQAG